MLEKKRVFTEEEYEKICCDVISQYSCESVGKDYYTSKIVWCGFFNEEKSFITDFELFNTWEELYSEIVEENIHNDLCDFDFDNYILDRKTLEDLGFEESDFE